MTHTDSSTSSFTPEQTRLWEQRRREVFWDREVDLATWRSSFLSGHPSYVVPTLDYLPIRDAIRLLGPAFSVAWPHVRLIALQHWKKDPRRIAKWDTVWSRLTTGSFDIKPLPEWKGLSKRRREFLMHVAFHQGQSIYATAKALKMPYKRAHEHAQWLCKVGFIRIRPQTHQGRTQHTLWVW